MGNIARILEREREATGDDRRFVWADGRTVVVASPKLPRSIPVRYAWANSPEGCNLTNASGLPAFPFRTDDWPGITRDGKSGTRRPALALAGPERPPRRQDRTGPCRPRLSRRRAPRLQGHTVVRGSSADYAQPSARVLSEIRGKGSGYE